MGLSQSDIQRTAEFVRKVTKASNVEAVVSETFEALKEIAQTDQIRVVYSTSPARWTEWKAAANGVEVRPPFLDDRIVGLAARLPEKYKIAGFETKVALRKTDSIRTKSFQNFGEIICARRFTVLNLANHAHSQKSLLLKRSSPG